MKILIFSLFCAIFSYAQTIATIVKVDGKVKVLKKDTIKKTKAKLKQSLSKEDMIITYRKSYATIKLNDGSLITLSPKSKLKIDDEMKFTQKEGKLFFNIKKREKNKLLISTNFATIGVKGTKFIVTSESNNRFEEFDENETNEENNISKDVNISVENNVSLENNSTLDNNISKENNETNTNFENNISKDINTSIDKNISLESNSTLDNNISKENNETNTSFEHNISKDINTTIDKNVSLENNESNISIKTLEENLTKENNISKNINLTKETNTTSTPKIIKQSVSLKSGLVEIKSLKEDFEIHKKREKPLSEFERYMLEQEAAFNEYKKKIEEEFIEYKKMFDLVPNKNVRFDGNKVFETENTKDINEEFIKFEQYQK